MYNRNDPRFRRRLNQISQNLESANESAQVGLFSFNEHYIKPCFGFLSAYTVEPCARCTEHCCADHWFLPASAEERERRRRRQARARGRPEYSFDFYDDWEEDETEALLALEDGETEEDGGEDGRRTQPQGRQRNMTYGSRGPESHTRPRKRTLGLPYDQKDATAAPSQSRFGFLGKLPFRTNGKNLRYKPSAADLQERSWQKKGEANQEQALNTAEGIDEEDDQHGDRGRYGAGDSRRRSTTTGSGHTTDSYSSRGDLFPSDDEDDAVPLGDEFAMTLERRATDDSSNGGKRNSTHTLSSRSSRQERILSRTGSEYDVTILEDEQPANVPTLADLRAEEQRTQVEEEEEIGRRRDAAMKLAKEKGLKITEETPRQTPMHSPSPQVSLHTRSDMSVPARQFTTDTGSAFPFPNVEMRATPLNSGGTSARSSISFTGAHALDRPT